LLLQQGKSSCRLSGRNATARLPLITLTFQQMSPVLQLPAFISVSAYLHASPEFQPGQHQQLKFNDVRDVTGADYGENVICLVVSVWLCGFHMPPVELILKKRQ